MLDVDVSIGEKCQKHSQDSIFQDKGDIKRNPSNQYVCFKYDFMNSSCSVDSSYRLSLTSVW